VGYDTSRPYIKSTIPSQNASGVTISDLIVINFNERMTSSTLTSDNIGIYKDPNVLLDNTTITYIDGTNTVTLDPSGNLDANTRYAVVVSGTVKDHFGNYMAMDFWWQFWTGSPSGVSYSSGTVTQYDQHDKVGYLEVVNTYPKNYSTNLGESSVHPIVIELNDDCEIGARNYFGSGDIIYRNPMAFDRGFFEIPSDSLAHYIEIDNHEVLGDPTVESTPPTYTVEPSGKFLYIWNRGMLTNNEYIVTLKEGLPGLRTESLSENYDFVFTTTYSPMYGGYNSIRLRIGPMLAIAMAYIPDDTLNRFIYESSREADRIFPYTIDPGNIPWYVREFVIYQAELNALYAAIMLFASSGAGVRKTLGDLTIDIDARGLMPALLPILDDLRNLRDYYKGMVEYGSDVGPSPTYAVRGSLTGRRPASLDTWTRLPFRDSRESDREYEVKANWFYTSDLVAVGTVSDQRYIFDGRYVTG